MARQREFDTEATIAAAMELFWRDGYAGTTMRDLALHTGVKAGSLHLAFGSKNGLFAAAFERYSEHFLACMPREQRGLRAIETYSARLAEIAAADPERRGCLIVNAAVESRSHDARTLAAVAARFDDMETFLKARFAEAVSDGELPADTDIVRRARASLSSIIGLLVLARVREDVGTLHDIARTVTLAG